MPGPVRSKHAERPLDDPAGRDRYQDDWFRAKRRALSHERPLASETFLHLDVPVRSVTRPSTAAQLGIDEEAARMRFTRARARLGIVMRKLKRGRLEELLRSKASEEGRS